MARKSKTTEVEIKEIKKDKEYELWAGKNFIGRVIGDDEKFDYVYNGKTSLKHSKNIDDAIHDLLMDYNLYNH